MKNQVAILAGGFGSRLRNKIGDIPKPMALLSGKPVLEYQIELCEKYGFRRIALLVYYQSNIIREHFGNGDKWGVEITYVEETIARGTAGAIRDALCELDEKFIVLYADTYVDVDLKRFWLHGSSEDVSATLLLHPNDHPYDSDVVEVTDEGFVNAIHPYPHPDELCYLNLVNAALYILRKNDIKKFIPKSGKYDLAKDIFKEMLIAGLRLKAYISPEYVKDMGTPTRMEKVERDLINGLPEKLSGRSRRKAVFLDRDGTLNKEVNHLNDPKQMVLLPKVCEAVKLLNQNGFLAIGITNQPVLARGDITWEGMDIINARLDHLLGNENAYLDRMYICPHHPDKGYDGEVSDLKIVCDCRKPSPGMIDQAVRDLDIDRRRSWMVGDSTSDILAGQRSGVRTILVRTGHAGLDYKYPVYSDYVCDTIFDAVKWIISGYSFAVSKLMPVAQATQNARLILIGGASRSGKTMAANVLKELITEIGRTVHIIPLDAWLKTPSKRLEGSGVLERYEMDNVFKIIHSIINAVVRVELNVPIWDRINSIIVAQRIYSIGPDDLLVIEGVPSLLHKELRNIAELLIHIDAINDVRHQRIHWEYSSRGECESEIKRLIKSREEDEVISVQEAARFAQYCINISE